MAKLIKGVNDLATTNPELAAQWNYEKNGDLRPEDVMSGSGKKVWWKLPYDVPMDYSVKSLRGKHFDFEWEAGICSRNSGVGCPFLSGNAVWLGFNDLITVNPELAKEWDYEGNAGLIDGKGRDISTPDKVTASANHVVSWKLPYDVPMDYPVESLRGKHFDFTWNSSIGNRTRGNGCPYLNGQAVWPGFNDLATINPILAAEWHPTKNDGLKSTDVPANAERNVWWKLPYDVPMDYPVESLRGKHFDFEWKSKVCNRTHGRGCPYLTGNAIWSGFNDLATTNPELAKEWNYEKNGDLKPTDVSEYSNQNVWWKVSYDVPMNYPVESLRGKHFDFEWEASPNDRTKSNGEYHTCAYLNGTKVWSGFNDLATVDPELAKEWNYEKNGDLKPTDITVGAKRNVWWKLPYDVPMDYPVESLRGKHFDFEWDAEINERTHGNGCPYLNGTRIWPGFNDLVTTNPELAKEWNYEKNKGLTNKFGQDISTPDKVAAYSNQKVWWKVSYDVPMDYPVESLRGRHFDFEWESSIANRSKGRECPYIPPACSKQESYMYMMLLDNNISFNREVQYKKSEMSGRFDIYLPENNMVIECDGHQHFKPNKHFNTKRSFDDWIKSDNECNDFCKEKGIKLLRLPYVMPLDKQWKAVQSVMNGGPIPESIINFYSRYDFSNYSKIASAMNNRLVPTKTFKAKAIPMKSNDVIPDTIDEEYAEPGGDNKEFE